MTDTTTQLQKKLLEWSANPIFNKDRSHPMAKFYYANGLEALLKDVTDAAVEDGISRETIMKFFIACAYEAMDIDNFDFSHDTRKAIADRIMKAVLDHHPTDRGKSIPN